MWISVLYCSSTHFPMINRDLLVQYSLTPQQHASPSTHRPFLSLPCPANASAYGKSHTITGTRPYMHWPVGWVVLIWAHTCAQGLWTHTGADASQAALRVGTTPSVSSLLRCLTGTCFDFVSSLSEVVEIASGLKSYWGRGGLREGWEDEECSCIIIISLGCQVRAVCMHF